MDEKLSVHLPVFEGPLALLLHLIEKNKLDIYDIPIVEITRQYLDYLKSWDDMNMEVASEFIVMAATLISIKARRLLPAAVEEQEEEEDEEERLRQRLILYKRYKEAAKGLEALTCFRRRRGWIWCFPGCRRQSGCAFRWRVEG